MPDQIYAPGPEPTPLVYDVPGSQRMIPRICFALYNGSGASGDYVPTLVYRSQAGHVIGRACAYDEIRNAGRMVLRDHDEIVQYTEDIAVHVARAAPDQIGERDGREHR